MHGAVCSWSHSPDFNDFTESNIRGRKGALTPIILSIFIEAQRWSFWRNVLLWEIIFRKFKLKFLKLACCRNFFDFPWAPQARDTTLEYRVPIGSCFVLIHPIGSIWTLFILLFKKIYNVLGLNYQKLSKGHLFGIRSHQGGEPSSSL